MAEDTDDTEPKTDEDAETVAGENLARAGLRPASEEYVAELTETEEEEAVLPAQIGYRRYVYAAFFTFAIALAYLFSKAGSAAWYRISQITPKVGEARDDLVTPVAAIIAAIVVFSVYRREAVRVLADEVALELSKVEWPTRDAVRRSTSIVVGASLGSSFLFWVYDIGTNRAVTFVTISDHPLLYGLAGGVIIYGIRALGIRYLIGKD